MSTETSPVKFFILTHKLTLLNGESRTIVEKLWANSYSEIEETYINENFYSPGAHTAYSFEQVDVDGEDFELWKINFENVLEYSLKISISEA